MAQQQKIDIPISDKYTPAERRAIAEDVIDFIVNRSKSGLDKNNNAFVGYSASYKDSLEFRIGGKSSNVDLTLSGDMLDSIELLRDRKGAITVGFSRGQENDKAEGNIIGSYGRSANPSKARDFLGIHPSDLTRILKQHPISKEKVTVESDALQSILERIGIAATIKTS